MTTATTTRTMTIDEDELGILFAQWHANALDDPDGFYEWENDEDGSASARTLLDLFDASRSTV